MKYIYILILGIIISGCSKNVKFQKSVMDSKEMIKETKVIEVDKLAEIIYSNDSTTYSFIDIRTPHEFSISHVKNAINIPLKVLNKDNCGIFCEKDMIFLIYGNSTSDAKIAVSFLKQIGIENVMAVGGGYEFIENNILKEFGIYSEPYDDEIALYDYKKVIQLTPKGNASSGNVGDVSFVPVTRKTEQVSGGCE